MKQGKQKSSGSLNGAKGGNTKMFGKSGVVDSKPGVSAPPTQPAFNKNMNKGGPAHRGNSQGGVRNSETGKVTVYKMGVGNNKDFSVKGGKTRMFGKGTSTTAKPV